MSLININGSVEIINDQCSQDSITELIRQYMGDDMAGYIEQTLKEKDEQNDDLLDTLKSVGKDLLLLLKETGDTSDIKELVETLDNIYSTVSDGLYYYNIAV